MTATDYKLVIESVRGEMKRDNKDDAIQVLRFEFGADTARDGSSGQARQKRRYTDVKFSKLIDRSSPTLQSMLATNSLIKKAVLSVYKANGNERLLYYQVTLADGYISNYRIVGQELNDEFGAIPRDEFSINFRKITVEYTKQNQQGQPDGTVTFNDQLDGA